MDNFFGFENKSLVFLYATASTTTTTSVNLLRTATRPRAIIGKLPADKRQR